MGKRTKRFFALVLALFMIMGLAFTLVSGYAPEDYYQNPSPNYIGICDDDTQDYLVNHAYFYVNAEFYAIYRREYHKPVYGGSSSPGTSVSGTLVSHANFTGTWTTPNQTFPIGEGVRGGFHARPNGNANNMHNGFTFLELDVATLAAQPNGVNVTIARSNQSNGNLPNANWNTPIGDYTYNVSIVNGQLVVTVNGFESGSWGATVTNNIANWGNNPNSAIRHQRNASLNLGNVSGTVFMFFHAQNMTFSAFSYEVVVGCEIYAEASGQFNVCRYEVYHTVAVYDAYGYRVYTGIFGEILMPLDGEINVGYHHFTVVLYIDGNFVDYRTVIVYVTAGAGYRLATIVYGNFIHFGHFYRGTTETVICDWC